MIEKQLWIAAKAYLSVELSVIPSNLITKIPAIKGGWNEYKGKDGRLPTLPEIEKWFNNGYLNSESAISLVCGIISSGLEIIDFDFKGEFYKPWSEKINQLDSGLFSKLVIESTQSGGFHVAYRCDDIAGNQKLAQKYVKVAGPGEYKYNDVGKPIHAIEYNNDWYIAPVMIETRGEGGQCLVAPSKGYNLIQSKYSQIKKITPTERDLLLNVARDMEEQVTTLTTFDNIDNISDGQVTTPTTLTTKRQHLTTFDNIDNISLKPGDDFNERGDIRAVLSRAGWIQEKSKGTTKAGGNSEHWRRPGKKHGTSGGLIDGKIFKVFSSNAYPLEADKSYNPFTLLTFLEYSGDFKAAAKALSAQGYGSKHCFDFSKPPLNPPNKEYNYYARACIKQDLVLRDENFDNIDNKRQQKSIFYLIDEISKVMEPKMVSFYADALNAKAKEPIKEKIISDRIQQKFKSSKVNLTSEIKEWVLETNGMFTSSDVYIQHHLVTRGEKKKASVILNRLVKDGIIEKTGTKNGCYRRIENECEKMDFMNATVEETNIIWPLNVHDYFRTMPGNIIIVAGEPDAGKTSFLLNTIFLNMHQFKMHYFNSEMGGSELRSRLENFETWDTVTQKWGKFELDKWKFSAWECTNNFQDVIKPGKGVVNLIDYVEVHEDFWKVGGILKSIHDKLKGAIAIVALQKKRGQDVAYGGDSTLQKARLYLSLFPGMLKIVKCKNWADNVNQGPAGLQINYKLVGGANYKFDPYGWYRPDNKK